MSTWAWRGNDAERRARGRRASSPLFSMDSPENAQVVTGEPERPEGLWSTSARDEEDFLDPEDLEDVDEVRVRPESESWAGPTGGFTAYPVDDRDDDVIDATALPNDDEFPWERGDRPSAFSVRGSGPAPGEPSAPNGRAQGSGPWSAGTAPTHPSAPPGEPAPPPREHAAQPQDPVQPPPDGAWGASPAAPPHAPPHVPSAGPPAVLDRGWAGSTAFGSNPIREPEPRSSAFPRTAPVADEYGLAAAVSRLRPEVAEAVTAPVAVVGALLVPGEAVLGMVQGTMLGNVAIVVLTNRRVLVVNGRRWQPLVDVFPITSRLAIRGRHDSNIAVLTVEDGMQASTVDNIDEIALAVELAEQAGRLIHG